MKKVKTIHNALALTAGAVTDGNQTQVDFGALGGAGREFTFGAKITENAVAAGGGRTVTLNYYWSEDNLASLASDAVRLARVVASKTSVTAFARSTSASVTKQFIGPTTPFRPLARYMIITLDKTTEDSGSVPTITLNLIRVPTTAKDV